MKGETAEYINIYALSKGDQILLCKSVKEENNELVFLWSTKNSRYQLSAAGIEYKRHLPKFNTFEHRYIAEVEYYWIDGNNKEFWKALADMNEFKLWDIENGPLKYYRNKLINMHRLAIYFVYEIDEIIKREDIVQYGGKFPPYNDKMLTPAGIDKVKNAKWEDIFRKYRYEDEFFERKDKILRTMNNFFGTKYEL